MKGKILLLFLLIFTLNTKAESLDSLLQNGAKLCEQGNISEGLPMLTEAKSGFYKSKNWSKYAEASVSYWFAYYQTNGNIDTVINSFIDLQSLIDTELPDSTTLKATIHLFRSFFYYYDSDIKKSMSETELALKLYNKERTRNLQDISSIYNNLGVLYSEQGNTKKAEDYMLKAIEIKSEFDKNGIPFADETLARNYLNLANIYYFSNRFELFFEYQKKLEETLKFAKLEPSVKLRLYKNYLRYYLRNDKNLRQAETYFKKLTQYEKTFDVDFYNQLGNEQLKVEYFEAKKEFEKAEQTQIKLVNNAEKYLASEELGLLEFYTATAEFYVRQSDFIKASEWSRKCLNLVSPISSTSLRNLGNKEIQYLAVAYGTHIATLYFQADSMLPKKYLEIEKYGNLYMNTLREYASRLEEISSLSAYLDYEMVLSAMMNALKKNQRPITKAMELIELKQALPLLKNKRDLSFTNSAKVSESLVQEFKTTNTKLITLRNTYNYKINSPKNDSIASKIQLLSDKKDSLNKLIKTDVTTKGGNIVGPIETSLSQSEIANNLGEDDCIIQYFSRGDELFIIVKSKTTERFLKKVMPFNIQNHILNIRRLVSSPSNWDKDSFLDYSHDLYKILIEPLETDIKNKNLVIVPTGIFNYLPFEILCKPAGNRLTYLVWSRSVRYLYSLKYNSKNSKQESNDMAFAPDFRKNSNHGYALRNGYDALAGAEKETSMLAQYFNFQLYKGDRATKSEFVQNAPKARLIHLASHAIVNEVDPLQSFILFDKANDPKNEQKLYAYELYEMSLNAELVVLSACNTGFGKLHEFSGVISLAKAFQFAGAKSTIMSLWPAQDESTAKLMELFYHYLDKGMSKSKALRKAKIQYLEEADEMHSQPFFWASFIIQGSNDPIPKSRTIWPFFVVSIVLIGGGIYFNRKRRSLALSA